MVLQIHIAQIFEWQKNYIFYKVFLKHLKNESNCHFLVIIILGFTLQTRAQKYEIEIFCFFNTKKKKKFLIILKLKNIFLILSGRTSKKKQSSRLTIFANSSGLLPSPSKIIIFFYVEKFILRFK